MQTESVRKWLILALYLALMHSFVCDTQSSSSTGSTRQRSSSGVNLLPPAHRTDQSLPAEKNTQRSASLMLSHSGNR